MTTLFRYSLLGLCLTLLVACGDNTNTTSTSINDADNDGVADATDRCSNTPTGQVVDGFGCAASQRDGDSDNVTDDQDACPNTAANVTVDSSGCPVDPDVDNDGVPDADDDCDDTPAGEPVADDGCPIPEGDPDSDGDTVKDSADTTCPNTPQSDIDAGSVDSNGCGASERDTDGDGVTDDADQCIQTSQADIDAGNVDAQGCGARQRDADNDTVSDFNDKCADTPSNEQPDHAGCSIEQLNAFDPFKDYGSFLSITPPGQADSSSGQGTENNIDDQAIMYENIVFTQDGSLVDHDDLTPDYFKDGSWQSETQFQNAGVIPQVVSNGMRTARIYRDQWGVPHIFGATRADVFFGTGYAVGQDRMFLTDILRHLGRGRLSDFLGASSINGDRGAFREYGYTEQEMVNMFENLDDRFGEFGSQTLDDGDAWVSGINQFILQANTEGNQPVEYGALAMPNIMPFTLRDAVAVPALIQATFAVGGGGEVGNVRFIQRLADEMDDLGLTAEQACELWFDLRHADDPEKSASSTVAFNTQSPPTIDESCPLLPGFFEQYPGVAWIDANSLNSYDPFVIEDCFSVTDCPDYGSSVADDPVNDGDTALTKPPATLDYFPGLSATQVAQMQAAKPALENIAIDPSKLKQAQQRVQEQVQTKVAMVTDFLAHMPETLSNALLVTAEQSQSGHPLAFFGPQTGYFSPEILMEVHLHSDGNDNELPVHTGGSMFPGIIYATIGRSVDFAWSATSAGDDITDQRVLKLCGSGSGATAEGYLYNGECTPFERKVISWTAEYNGVSQPPYAPGCQTPAFEPPSFDPENPEPPIDCTDPSTTPVPAPIGRKVTATILRAPDYGPVTHFATTDGEPVAIVRQRSTYFGEVDSIGPFLATAINQIHDVQSFNEAFNRLTGTFNWFYIDTDNIAYFNSGLLPKRHPDIHPLFPQWGTGEYDWAQQNTGQLATLDFDNFLPLEAHPNGANPAKGYMTSWNNAQAPGWWGNDSSWGYGPVHRVDMLDKRLQAFQDAGLKHTIGSMAEIMVDAATTDLRGQEVVPAVLQVIQQGAGPALNTDQQAVVDAMNAWITDGRHNLGAMRRDRDGPVQDVDALRYTHRDAAAFMDTWWNQLINHTLPQVLPLEGRLRTGRHDSTGAGGSAFQNGYYGYVRRVMDMALGSSNNPYRQLKCAGTGQLDDCRAAVLASIDATLANLGTDPNNWAGTGNRRPERQDRIRFSPAGLYSPPDTHWQNRPTYQQGVEVTQPRSE